MTAPLATGLPVADARTTFAELGRGLRARPWALTGTVIVLVGGSVAALAVPALLGAIVDAISSHDPPAITGSPCSSAWPGSSLPH